MYVGCLSTSDDQLFHSFLISQYCKNISCRSETTQARWHWAPRIAFVSDMSGRIVQHVVNLKHGEKHKSIRKRRSIIKLGGIVRAFGFVSQLEFHQRDGDPIYSLLSFTSNRFHFTFVNGSAFNIFFFFFCFLFLLNILLLFFSLGREIHLENSSHADELKRGARAGGRKVLQF